MLQNMWEKIRQHWKIVVVGAIALIVFWYLWGKRSQPAQTVTGVATSTADPNIVAANAAVGIAQNNANTALAMNAQNTSAQESLATTASQRDVAIATVQNASALSAVQSNNATTVAVAGLQSQTILGQSHDQLMLGQSYLSTQLAAVENTNATQAQINQSNDNVALATVQSNNSAAVSMAAIAARLTNKLAINAAEEFNLSGGTAVVNTPSFQIAPSNPQ